jgi:hypothetical protein
MIMAEPGASGHACETGVLVELRAQLAARALQVETPATPSATHVDCGDGNMAKT